MAVAAPVLMYDATHANVDSIPLSAAKVAGYITGTPDIKWTQADWDRFPHAAHIQIDQGDGSDATSQATAHALKVGDVEPGALTAQQAAAICLGRLKAGIAYTTLYADRTDAAKLLPALEAADKTVAWHAHIRLWLADPSVTQAEAAAMLNTTVDGLVCRAVQFHFGATTDMSVTAPDWYPAPKPPAPVTLKSVSVTARYSDGSTKTADF